MSEYWVVDPVVETIRVYRPLDGQFGRPFELKGEAGDVLTTPEFDGLELPLRKIFE